MNSKLEYLSFVRKYLHQHPEISGEETNTAKFLLSEIEKLKPTEILKHIAGHGFLAVFDSGLNGQSFLFRAELDGLPINDTLNAVHRSQAMGKGHQCGHDGHMTILLGLAIHLSENPPKEGTVSLLFQPAEETGKGAEAVVNHPEFRNRHFDAVFALHNLPGFGFGEIVVKEGAFTASVESLKIKLYGKTAHAAEPENGLNPGLAVADMIQSVAALNVNTPQQNDFRLATLVHCKIGELAYGVSAGEAELHFTLRSWIQENLLRLKSEIIELVQGIAKSHQLKVTSEGVESFYANQNHEEAVSMVRKACNDKKLKLHEAETPFKWGEDFGFFTHHYKGCLFGLGAGKNQAALHHPDYDFPDELIPIGIEIFKGIIQQKTK